MGADTAPTASGTRTARLCCAPCARTRRRRCHLPPMYDRGRRRPAAARAGCRPAAKGVGRCRLRCPADATPAQSSARSTGSPCRVQTRCVRSTGCPAVGRRRRVPDPGHWPISTTGIRASTVALRPSHRVHRENLSSPRRPSPGSAPRGWRRFRGPSALARR